MTYKVSAVGFIKVEGELPPIGGGRINSGVEKTYILIQAQSYGTRW